MYQGDSGVSGGQGDQLIGLVVSRGSGGCGGERKYQLWARRCLKHVEAEDSCAQERAKGWPGVLLWAARRGWGAWG
jgi:hypothetical protein